MPKFRVLPTKERFYAKDKNDGRCAIGKRRVGASPESPFAKEAAFGGSEWIDTARRVRCEDWRCSDKEGTREGQPLESETALDGATLGSHLREACPGCRGPRK